jgi:hypothetical protein
MPNHQVGFRHAHSTVQQCHRIIDVINKALEKRQYCTVEFLDVTTAFDRVRHKGSLVKIKRTFPPGYFKLMKEDLHNREFEVKVDDMVSENIPYILGGSGGRCFWPHVIRIIQLGLASLWSTGSGHIRRQHSHNGGT